jgi:hypothetical protein
MRAIQEDLKTGQRKRIEENSRKCGLERRARSPWRRLMQVTGSNVRNEHLVLSAPGCFGVDGAGEFSYDVREEVGCRWSCLNSTAGWEQRW